MKDYNAYVQAINNIFNCLEVMKRSWPAEDNINYIKKIEESKNDIMLLANKLKDGIK